MRSSDWSSDVCSSDLFPPGHSPAATRPGPTTSKPTLRPGSALLLADGPVWVGKYMTGVAVDAGDARELNGTPGLFRDFTDNGFGWRGRMGVVSGRSVSVRVDHGGRRTLHKKIH